MSHDSQYPPLHLSLVCVWRSAEMVLFYILGPGCYVSVCELRHVSVLFSSTVAFPFTSVWTRILSNPGGWGGVGGLTGLCHVSGALNLSLAIRIIADKVMDVIL